MKTKETRIYNVDCNSTENFTSVEFYRGEFNRIHCYGTKDGIRVRAMLEPYEFDNLQGDDTEAAVIVLDKCLSSSFLRKEIEGL